MYQNALSQLIGNGIDEMRGKDESNCDMGRVEATLGRESLGSA